MPYLFHDSAALLRAKRHELICKGSAEIKRRIFMHFGIRLILLWNLPLFYTPANFDFSSCSPVTVWCIASPLRASNNYSFVLFFFLIQFSTVISSFSLLILWPMAYDLCFPVIAILSARMMGLHYYTKTTDIMHLFPPLKDSLLQILLSPNMWALTFLTCFIWTRIFVAEEISHYGIVLRCCSVFYSYIISVGHLSFFFACGYRYVTRLDVILRFMLSFKIIMSSRCDWEFLFTISTFALHLSEVMLLVNVGTVSTQLYQNKKLCACRSCLVLSSLRFYAYDTYRIFLGIRWSKKLAKCYIGIIASFGAETGTLRKVDQNYLGSFEMWCWRRMGKISWTDRVRNEEVWYRVKEERNILQTIERRKANWISHVLRRNCLLKHVNERKVQERIEVMGRRGRRHNQLLDDRKETRGYWKLKEESLDRTLWRTRFGRDCGPVARQTAEWMTFEVRVKFSRSGNRSTHIRPRKPTFYTGFRISLF
jgi:hypothetical protein